MYNHTSNSIQGYLSIKAYGLENKVYNHFNQLQDIHGGAWLLFCGTSRWLSIRLDTIIAIYITVVSVIMIPLSQDDSFKELLRLTPASIGLSLSQTATMLGSIQWAVRQSSEAENYLTSVERIFEYASLRPEPDFAPSSSPDKEPKVEGPNSDISAAVKFDFDRVKVKEQINQLINKSNVEKVDFMKKEIRAQEYNYRYSKDTALVLKDLNFQIKIGEKIGIVGRTGAGKSSLISSLFRMNNADSGCINFDDKNIGQVHLAQLRSSISIIPQEPIIFSDSIRRNLDPTEKYSDSDLWSVLEKVQLKEFISEKKSKLEFQLAQQGANLSVGQKQLLCLGRAIIKNNKILLIDEATANVDPGTDELIQETIKSEFSNCTVLTIAHRLNTIINSDRIMVLDSGNISEFDSPKVLLQKEDSIFREMVDQSKDAPLLYNAVSS